MVLLVEDQKLICDLLHRELQEHPQVNRCEAVRLGEEAVARCEQEEFDLVVLDLQLPDIDGFTVAERIRKITPDIKIIAVSARHDPRTLTRVHRLRLQGYFDKNQHSLDVLSDALAVVLDGSRWFSQSMLDFMREHHKDQMNWERILSTREQDLVSRLGSGIPVEDVGLALGISPNTIRRHQANILKKLGLHSVVDLIRWAHEQGFASLYESFAAKREASSSDDEARRSD